MGARGPAEAGAQLSSSSAPSLWTPDALSSASPAQTWHSGPRWEVETGSPPPPVGVYTEIDDKSKNLVGAS